MCKIKHTLLWRALYWSEWVQGLAGTAVSEKSNGFISINYDVWDYDDTVEWENY